MNFFLIHGIIYLFCFFCCLFHLGELSLLREEKERLERWINKNQKEVYGHMVYIKFNVEKRAWGVIFCKLEYQTWFWVQGKIPWEGQVSTVIRFYKNRRYAKLCKLLTFWTYFSFDETVRLSNRATSNKVISFFFRIILNLFLMWWNYNIE